MNSQNPSAIRSMAIPHLPTHHQAQTSTTLKRCSPSSTPSFFAQRSTSSQHSLRMDRKQLPDQPPSFTELRAMQTQDDPDSNRKITESILSGLDSCVPLASPLPRLLLFGIDHATKKKQDKIRRVCSRLQELYVRAGRVADSGDWVSRYHDLVSRFTVFARQYEKKRRVLLRIARRVKSGEDAEALEAFHREIDSLYIERSRG